MQERFNGGVCVCDVESVDGALVEDRNERQRSGPFRSKGLDSTGVPAPFTVEYYAFTENHALVEKTVHRALQAERPNKQREFFDCSIAVAVSRIREAAGPGLTFERVFYDDRTEQEIKATRDREAAAAAAAQRVKEVSEQRRKAAKQAELEERRRRAHSEQRFAEQLTTVLNKAIADLENAYAVASTKTYIPFGVGLIAAGAGFLLFGDHPHLSALLGLPGLIVVHEGQKQKTKNNQLFIGAKEMAAQTRKRFEEMLVVYRKFLDTNARWQTLEQSQQQKMIDHYQVYVDSLWQDWKSIGSGRNRSA